VHVITRKRIGTRNITGTCESEFLPKILNLACSMNWPQVWITGCTGQLDFINLKIISSQDLKKNLKFLTLLFQKF
jgi:hypothetical protein